MRYGSAAAAFCGSLFTSPAGFSLKLLSSKPRDGTSSSPSLDEGEASSPLGLRKLTEMKKKNDSRSFSPLWRLFLTGNPSLYLPCGIFRLAQVSAQVGRPEGFDQLVGAARTRRGLPLVPTPSPQALSQSLEEVSIPGWGPSYNRQSGLHHSATISSFTCPLQNPHLLLNHDQNSSPQHVEIWSPSST